MSTSADPTAEQVSSGVVAFTGWGEAKMPRADTSAVAALAAAAGLSPEALLEEVLTAVSASETLDTHGLDPRSLGAGDEYRRLLHAARPDLDDSATDALASRWFYRRLWVGVDTLLIDPPAVTRYFALFAPRGGERVPQALFRRQVIGDRVVDEVLRDTDRWDADRSGRVERAITRYLDSDLEEISPSHAQEFEQMVAERRYRPFRT
ncbi:hypothetical protein AB1K54_15990 [Microbacterium sp. BWT-B31]|uniref:hypothetical protein n=1 Tax=Microbacterium sp. BWT-B31 TaxID=3232072 RepID=UPI003528B6CE